MRVPTSWREKGTYTLRVNCEGEGGTVQAFATRGFEVIGEAELAREKTAFDSRWRTTTNTSCS